jgi:hypothetical protein
MDRRKFIAAMGSLAAGGAAVTGTGAFTNVSAERSVSVNVSSDDNAYVGVDTTVGENSNFAELDGGRVDVSLDGDGVTGAGINEKSNNGFLELFQVKNQGTQPAFFFVDPTTATIGGKSIYKGNTDDYIDPQATSLPGEGEFGGSLTGVYRPGKGGTSSIDISNNPTRKVFPPSKIASAFDVIFDRFTEGDRPGHDLFVVPEGQSFNFGLVVKENGDGGFGDVSIDLRASASAVNL